MRSATKPCLLFFLAGILCAAASETAGADIPAPYAWVTIDIFGLADGKIVGSQLVFNPDNILELETVSAGIQQNVDLEVAAGSWLSGQLHTGGTVDVLPETDYTNITGEIYNWEAALHNPSGLWLVRVGDYTPYTDNSRILGISNRPLENMKDSYINAEAELTIGSSVVSALYIPEQDELENHSGALRFTSLIGTLSIDALAGWSDGIWLGAGADIPVGSSIIVYANASYLSRTFFQEYRSGLQALIGGSYAAEWLRGTVFLELLANTAGHTAEDWQKYIDAAVNPAVYGEFIENFPFFSQSLLYSAIHWELQGFVVEGLHAGVSLMYSFPQDLMTRAALRYEAESGLYFDVEARGVLPSSKYEWMFVPETVKYSLQLGWVYRS